MNNKTLFAISIGILLTSTSMYAATADNALTEYVPASQQKNLGVHIINKSTSTIAAAWITAEQRQWIGMIKAGTSLAFYLSKNREGFISFRLLETTKSWDEELSSASHTEVTVTDDATEHFKTTIAAHETAEGIFPASGRWTT